MRVDIVWQTAPSELVPQSIGLVRVMVSRQQVPLYRVVSPHSFDDLIARVRTRRCVVVDVTRDQYMAHVVLVGEIADAGDRLQSCQLETTHLRAIDKAKYFANLPVGGMNKAESQWLNTSLRVRRDPTQLYIVNPTHIRDQSDRHILLQHYVVFPSN